tara:strand:- start:30 stop:299 length:270 start_codon:yes stop_codon:yes gene_type:complete
MNYDKSEPKHVPVIISVILTIVLILFMTIGLIIYFKGSLQSREQANIQLSGNYIELDEVQEYEDNYLNYATDGRITIDEAITIINTNYN